MKITEYRIPLPFTLEEYQVGQVYMVAKASASKTSGNEGIETVKNEPFEDERGKGQYTFKIFHLASHVPRFIRAILPRDALILEEEAWNAFPYCKTVYRNRWLKKRFHLQVESIHVPDAGTSENPLNMPPDHLKKRQVVHVDLAIDKGKSKEYSANEDPTIYHSERSGRGPLIPGWKETTQPMMCAYKAVTIEFKWFGLQRIVESYAINLMRDIFLNSHKQLFCWQDEWYGLSVAEARAFERRTIQSTNQALEEARENGLPTPEPLADDASEASTGTTAPPPPSTPPPPPAAPPAAPSAPATPPPAPAGPPPSN